MKLLLGVAALFLCTGVSAIAAQTGIAYDEISELYISRPLPLPEDFAKVYADVNNTAHALSRTVSHMAFLGNLRRAETEDGTVVLDRPDVRKYFVLNTRAKTYSSRAFVPRTAYSIDAGLPTPPLNAVKITATAEGVNDSWPPRTIDGRVFNGVTARIFIEVTPNGSCGLAQTAASVTIFATPSLTEQEFFGDYYAAPLNFANRMLSRYNGCDVQEPVDLLKQFPTYPGFVLYRAVSVLSGPSDLRFTQLNDGPIAMLMRGNLRVRTDADKALFDIPPGYAQVQRP